MADFNPQPILDDFAEFSQIMQTFLDSVPDDGWALRTGERDVDWTVHQTLAHLVYIAKYFNDAVEAALNNTTLDNGDFTYRAYLKDWNNQQIAAWTQFAPPDLQIKLQAEFDRAATFAAHLKNDQLDIPIFLPVYNRPAPLINYIDWQFSHAGAVHGAQITRPITNIPLWTSYSTAFTHRLIDRYIRHFSIAYWPDVGGDLHQTLNFTVDGEAGGTWHLVAAPDGGTSGQGLVDGAEHHLHFADANALFGIFSLQLSMRDVLKSGQLRIEGDFKETFGVIRLFSASPPSA